MHIMHVLSELSAFLPAMLGGFRCAITVCEDFGEFDGQRQELQLCIAHDRTERRRGATKP